MSEARGSDPLAVPVQVAHHPQDTVERNTEESHDHPWLVPDAYLYEAEEDDSCDAGPMALPVRESVS